MATFSYPLPIHHVHFSDNIFVYLIIIMCLNWLLFSIEFLRGGSALCMFCPVTSQRKNCLGLRGLDSKEQWPRDPLLIPNRLWMREPDRVLLWSGSTCGHFYMIGISKVAFSAQAAITLRIMSSIFYSTHFPLLSNAQQCTVASSTIASSIWLLTHLLLHSLAI